MLQYKKSPGGWEAFSFDFWIKSKVLFSQALLKTKTCPSSGCKSAEAEPGLLYLNQQELQPNSNENDFSWETMLPRTKINARPLNQFRKNKLAEC